MFEIITTILFIIFVSVALIVFFRMRKTIRDYQEENMRLQRRLDEEENKHLEFKIPKLPNLIRENCILEEHNATEVLTLYDYERIWESGNKNIIKSNLAWCITEQLLNDDVFRFVIEQDMLNDEVLITAILKVFKEK